MQTLELQSCKKAAPMNYDIFISYAHVNDDPLPPATKGWVTTFVVGLKNKLAQELGRKEAYRLWMDYELRGNDAVTPTIHEILDGAGALVLFLSKGYLESAWCREELKRFVDRVGPNSGQIFVVALSPVVKMPDSIADLKKYDFWTMDDAGKPRMLAVPTPDPTERTYYHLQEDLACDLARKIEEIKLARQPAHEKEFRPQRPAVTPASPSNFVVFVEAADDDLDLARQIAGCLQARGFGFVLPLAALAGFDPNRVRAVELRRDRDRNLKDCDAVLIPYRAGPLCQVREHIGAWRMAGARRKAGSPMLSLFQQNPDTMAVGVRYPGMAVLFMSELCAEDCVRRFAEAVVAVGDAP